jgi:hypothetical protein
MIRLEGFDEFCRQLERLKRNAERLDGEHAVSFEELFSDAFMRRHTRFPSMQAMFDASPFKIASQADFDAIPDNEWDRYVRSSTTFPNWKDMMQAAGAAYVERKLMS